METRAKWDLNAPLIIGITFLFMGIVYLGISLALFLSPTDTEGIVVRSVFLPLGLVLFFVGFILLSRAAAKKHRADQLIADGRYIWATVTELREIPTINGLRGHPCVILAQYTDPQGQTHFFQSRCLYRKLNDSIVEKAVKVYIQGTNFASYYMDVEPLLVLSVGK